MYIQIDYLGLMDDADERVRECMERVKKALNLPQTHNNIVLLSRSMGGLGTVIEVSEHLIKRGLELSAEQKGEGTDKKLVDHVERSNTLLNEARPILRRAEELMAG